jgi:hypothetical protein
MRKILALLALTAALGLSGYALASDDIHFGAAATGKWLSEETIKTKLAELGYAVREIESEDGRYEVTATDKQGARIELYVNPVTGEILKPEEEHKERS